MAEIRFDLTTFEGGRMVVRTARVEIEAGAGLDRLEVRADGDVVLSLPFTIDVAEDDEDEPELVSFNQVFHQLYEPGELAQPGTYGPEVLDGG